MSDNLNAEGRVTLTVNDAQFKLMVDLVADADRGTSEYAKTLDQLEKKLVSAGASASKAAGDIHKVVQAYAAHQSSLEGMMRFGGAQAQMETRFHKAQEKSLQDSEKAYQSYSSNILAAARNRAAEEQRLIEQTYAQNMPKALKASQDAAYESYAANIRYTQQQERMLAELPRARYALYDVAQTYGMVSAAALGAATAVGAVGISFQTSFAQVQRTTGVTGDAIGQLRTDLEDLTTTIPESFADIADIASLGGQLGIAADGIEDFTEVTAKLTATTDLSADAAGTALGRFQALLGVPSHEFENLASSILKVGINSVATETQIVQIATQISSMGDFAGLTADQVVGLAGALASTGTQPELARGTVTRLFTLMSKAVGEAGDQLNEFARVSGVSAADFQRAWGTSDFADVFQQFLRGLSVEGQAAIETLKGIPAEVIESAESFDELGLSGNNVVETLNALGITSVRDVPALLRLAGAGQVVTDAFSDAATGFADGTELAEQYAIIAETVAAKLSTLGNTLQAIMANIADSGTLSILGGVLDLVQRLSEVFLAISRNPVGKVILGVVTGFTALLGVIAAVSAAQMLFRASVYAMVTAQNALAASTGGVIPPMRTLLAQMVTMSAASRTAAAAQTQFNAAQTAGVAATTANTAAVTRNNVAKGTLLRTVGSGAARFGAWGLAIGGVLLTLEQLLSTTDRAKDRFDDLFGSVSGFTQAIREDTQNVDEAAQVFRTVQTTSGNAAQGLDDNTTAVEANVRAQLGLKEQVEDSTDAIDGQIIKLGESTLAFIANSLASNDEFIGFWQQYGGVIDGVGLSLEALAQNALAAEGGATRTIQSYLDAYTAELDSVSANLDEIEQLRRSGEKVNEEHYLSLLEIQAGLIREKEALTALRDEFVAVELGLSKATTAGEIWNQITGEGSNAAGDASDEVAGLTQEMIDATNAIWGSIDAVVALENSMYGLGASIAENGLDFSATSEAGRANLSSLGQVINAVMADAVANGTSAADAIAGLMQALSAMGVNVAQDLAFLNDMVAALGGATGAGGLNTAMLDAMRGMERGFGSVVPKAVNRTRDSVKQVQKELRTTADYASDLSKVMGDAFDFRFGKEIAKDNTKQLWQDMKDRIKDAKDRAKELRLEIQAIRAAQASLQSRKAVLTYQLGIARSHGDTLREQEILAELGEVNSDLADNKKDLKDANKSLKETQDELKLSTEGNTQAARDQREAMRDLLKSYQDQIEEAANSGLSQDQLKKKVKQLKEEFEDQAKKIGIPQETIDKYSKNFDDMAKITEKVPRDVTTEWKANASPAEKALADFKEKLDKERKKIEKPFRLRGTFDSKINSNITGLKAAQQALAEALRAQAKAYKNQPGGGTQVDYWDNKVNYWRRQLAQYKGYAEGGFTGRGGKYESAGTVHRGEFVFPQSMVNQNTGLPYANVLGSMAHAMGAMSGGGSGTDIQLVELLPNQLRELGRIVSTTINMDGTAIARTTNGFNAAQYGRGAG